MNRHDEDIDTAASGRLWIAKDGPLAKPVAAAPTSPFEQDIRDMPPALTVPGNRVYAPFELRSRPESLILFCATLPSQFPAYHHLMNISFESLYGQTFSLFYPFMTVTITGQRLAEIVHAINARKCAMIRQWHPDLYDPPERGIPVIEKIQILSGHEGD